MFGFYPQTSEKFPDFLLELNGLPIAVEAMLMMKSEKEEYFGKWAGNLVKQVFDQVVALDRFQPFLNIVIKSSEALPNPPEIIDVLRQGLVKFGDKPLVLQSALFNLFIDPCSAPRMGLTCYRYCAVLRPRSINEDLRVQDRSKHASKQLSAVTEGKYPGLMCLGITKFQQPHIYINYFGTGFPKGSILLFRASCWFRRELMLLLPKEAQSMC